MRTQAATLACPDAAFMCRYSIDTDGCWRWNGGAKNNGYGQYRGATVQRYAYELFIGPIPAGLHIDHLCGTRDCVNPDHLEAVTKRENNLRSSSPAALNARKTHCKRGHEFNDANTAHYQGRRTCRTCVNDAARRRRAAKWGEPTERAS